jgi:hypothetical protein
MFSRKNFIIGLSIMSLGLGGCQETDADKIGDAQLCIDKATAATVNSCLSKIEGIETPAANVLRCSAGFIEEGFDQADRLISSLEELDSGGEGSAGLMSLIAFKSKSGGSLNKAFASATAQYCLKSGQKGLSLLGTLAKSATILAALVDGALSSISTIDPADIRLEITALLNDAAANDPTALATVNDIGAAVAATYQIACSGSASTSDMCREMVEAIDTNGVDINDSEAVGQEILRLWRDSTGN